MYLDESVKMFLKSKNDLHFFCEGCKMNSLNQITSISPVQDVRLDGGFLFVVYFVLCNAV